MHMSYCMEENTRLFRMINSTHKTIIYFISLSRALTEITISTLVLIIALLGSFLHVSGSIMCKLQLN